MRLMTWNCRVGGFRHKAKRVAPFRPDVLVVQEVEPIAAVERFAGDLQPPYRDRLTNAIYNRRGIGVFSYTDAQIRAVDTLDPSPGFRRYEVCCEGHHLQVVGVWTAAPDYKQADEGLARHADWIRQRPTVVLGDFNNNGRWGGSWRSLMAVLAPLGLVSAYHRYFSEPFGDETRKTYFDTRKLKYRTEIKSDHLDHCFLPAAWAAYIKRVEVGGYEDWHRVSDHMPLIVDLDLLSPTEE